MRIEAPTLLSLGEVRGHDLEDVVPRDRDAHLVARAALDPVVDLSGSPDDPVVDRDDAIAHADLRALGGRALGDASDEDSYVAGSHDADRVLDLAHDSEEARLGKVDPLRRIGLLAQALELVGSEGTAPVLVRDELDLVPDLDVSLDERGLPARVPGLELDPADGLPVAHDHGLDAGLVAELASRELELGLPVGSLRDRADRDRLVGGGGNTLAPRGEADPVAARDGRVLLDRIDVRH